MKFSSQAMLTAERELTEDMTISLTPAFLDPFSDSGEFTLLGSVTLASPASTLIERGSLLAVQETDNSVDLFDATLPAKLSRVGRGTAPGCLWFDLNQADGTLDSGLWIPLGVYGVSKIGLSP